MIIFPSFRRRKRFGQKVFLKPVSFPHQTLDAITVNSSRSKLLANRKQHPERYSGSLLNRP